MFRIFTTLLTVLCNLKYNVCGSPEYEWIQDLPLSMINDLFTIINQGQFPVVPWQSLEKAKNVRFYLFTKRNPNNATILNSVKQLFAKKRIKILLHGYLGNHNVQYIRVIKDAYLERHDYNVISVDYSEYARNLYSVAFSYVQSVGVAVAKFICKLIYKVRPKFLHVIGVSLGAQVAGVAGHQTKKQCRATIERITGLDPAGTLFTNTHEDLRLDSQDAKLVDVIHTNHRMFGYSSDCGDVDFYVNCGYFQPGCPKFQNIADLFNLPIELIVCHHLRSCYLFVESIKSDSFRAMSCHYCGHIFCSPKFEDYTSPTNVYMGESCWTKPKESKYLVVTNAKPPYAKGPTRFPKALRCK